MKIPSFGTLELEEIKNVAYLRFNRPESRNGLNGRMMDEMYRALTYLAARDELSVVVLTGVGSTFCPGADLRATPEERGGGVLSMEEAYQTATMLHQLPQFTIAAVNGACAGAGLAWASACDYRVANDKAKFATAFLELGLSGELGVAWTLVRALGATAARELLFFPSKLTAGEARHHGFVSRVFQDESFDGEVDALVSELASRHVPAVRSMKQNILDAERLPLREFVDAESARQAVFFSGEAGLQTKKRMADTAVQNGITAES